VRPARSALRALTGCYGVRCLQSLTRRKMRRRGMELLFLREHALPPRARRSRRMLVARTARAAGDGARSAARRNSIGTRDAGGERVFRVRPIDLVGGVEIVFQIVRRGGEIPAVGGTRGPVVTPHRSPEAAVQVRVGILEIADNFEVDSLHLREIDLFDMNETQELPHGLRHFAPALIARPAALRDPNLRPELFLIEAQPTANFARVQYTVK